jgi:murein DD-endopeptidase
MTERLTRRAVAAIPLVAILPQVARAGQPARQPPAALVRVALVCVEGRRRVLFELHIDKVLAVTVRDADDGALLRTFDGAELASRQAGAATFLELDPPETVRRLLVEAGGRKLEIDLPRDDGPMLGPPLRGGPWAAIYKAEWPRGHRRVFYSVDGVARLPGRTAIDWVLLDDQGRIATGDPDLARNALGYGAEVLAVADATVAASRDGVPEVERVSANSKHAENLAAGNYVSLDLGGGRFAIYEHLIPGSLRLKPGDPVRKGQVIGQLGFSGDSTGPHLHLHVADAARPLLGEGVGYGFEAFALLGRYEDLGRLGSSPWTPLAGLDPARRNELPASNVVVRFPT